MSAQWDKYKAEALKMLGDGGEVPDMPANVDKAGETHATAKDGFDASRADCAAKLLAMQNSNDALSNGLTQFLAKIEKSDLGLNPKDKDELKKILKARAFLTGKLNAAVKHWTAELKMLEELDKHLEQLGKYKQKPGAI